MNRARHRYAASLAHGIVWIEHLARIAWAPVSLALLFLAFANFDVLPLLPSWLHATVVLAAVAAIAGSLRQGIVTHGRPFGDAGQRRVERDSGLPGRPYDVLHDTPIGNGELGFALWKTHQDRARAALSQFRLRLPRSDLAAHDTRAWRALALMLFCLSLAVAGTTGFSSRLDAALSPRVMGGIAARDISVDAWLTPPAYTALPPVVLPKGRVEDVPEVPQGSMLQVRVGGGTARPHVEVNGKRYKFQAVGPHDFEVAETLQDESDIRITQGWRTLARWHVGVTETAAPVIAWNSLPKAAERGEAKLDYTAADPYGLAHIRARIELPQDEAAAILPKGTALEQPGARVHEVDLPDVADHPKSVKAGSVQDWADSPWAGLKVQLTLTATGVSGLTGATNTVDFVLPERVFTNPAAREIAAQRKRLIRDPLATRIDVATAIVTLGSRPELYGNDAAAFLALRIAAMRIYRDATLADLPGAEAMLWQTAVRLEDGGKSDAQKELAKAAEALRQALARNAPSAEIADLTAALKKAMQRYMAEMQREMQKRLANGEKVPEIPPDLSGTMMDQKKLADMIDRMQSMAESGSRDAASDLLNQFESMMQNMRMAQSKGDSKTAQAWQALKNMRGLAERQQALNDRNYQRSQGQPPPQNPEADAKEQQDVQSMLKDLQDKLKALGAPPPESLNQSQQDMDNAGKGMQQRNYSSATGSGRSALDELRQGMQSLSEQIGKQMGQQQGENGQEGQGSDPFGRGGDGGKSGDDGKVTIPDQSAQQRSREVLDELRKRDGDRTLPRPEHDYIDRLLREF